MVFTNNNLNYRIAFDTHQNIFMAIDANDDTKVGYGITIEQAFAALQKNS